MGRKKINNPLSEQVLVRMDKKLMEQLERYATSENVFISSAARKAIKSFILETTTIDKINKL